MRPGPHRAALPTLAARRSGTRPRRNADRLRLLGGKASGAWTTAAAGRLHPPARSRSQAWSTSLKCSSACPRSLRSDQRSWRLNCRRGCSTSTTSPVRALLGRARREMRRPWLRPLTRSLSPPGGPLIRTISTRGGSVSAVASTPDGRRALAACRDGRIEVWDIEHGALARTLYGHGVFARCVACTRPGRAPCGSPEPGHGRMKDPQELRVWDLDPGPTDRGVRGTRPRLRRDRGAARREAGGLRRPTTGPCVCCDLDDGHAIHVLRGHAWYVQALSVSADGRVAASGADDGTIRISWISSGARRFEYWRRTTRCGLASPDEIPPGGLIGIAQATGVASLTRRATSRLAPPHRRVCASGRRSIRAPSWRGFRSAPAIPGSRATATGWCSSSVLFRFGISRRGASSGRPIPSHPCPPPSPCRTTGGSPWSVRARSSESGGWSTSSVGAQSPRAVPAPPRSSRTKRSRSPSWRPHRRSRVGTSGRVIGSGRSRGQARSTSLLFRAGVRSSPAVGTARWNWSTPGASVIFGDRPHGERPAGSVGGAARGRAGPRLWLHPRGHKPRPRHPRMSTQLGGSGLSAIHCSSWTTRRRTTSRYHGQGRSGARPRRCGRAGWTLGGGGERRCHRHLGSPSWSATP